MIISIYTGILLQHLRICSPMSSSEVSVSKCNPVCFKYLPLNPTSLPSNAFFGIHQEFPITSFIPVSSNQKFLNLKLLFVTIIATCPPGSSVPIRFIGDHPRFLELDDILSVDNLVQAVEQDICIHLHSLLTAILLKSRF